MTHRHLFPNEIDLLVDGDAGFGIQPLREHVRGCQDCRARLDSAVRVAARLTELPPIAPRYGLADRVMARVPVFVPWQEAVRDALVQRMLTVPALRPVAAALIAVVGTVLTGVTFWIASRGDLIAMLTGLAGEGAQAAATDAAGRIVVSLFGPQVVTVVQQLGPLGLALAAAGFVGASLLTVAGLRHLATTSARS